MQPKSLRRWAWIHKWTSLICTLFLLMLCITGLPLIFHHEIDDLLGVEVEAPTLPVGTPMANIDKVVAVGMEKAPGKVPHFLVWDRDEPNVILLSVNDSITADPSTNHLVRVDARTAQFLDAPDFRTRFTYIMLKLHTDMFAELPGKLFLGLMGILFVLATISGIVLYAPSMRKLSFGTVRSERRRMVRWLDLHNLIGVVTAAWVIVVGFTGVLNTWADLIIKIWQFDQLSHMTAAYKDKPVPTHFASVQAAVDTARRVMPDMTPSFVAYPGSLFTSKQHYAVFMRGNTPVTSRLLRPALIDAATGELTDSRDMPWYVSTLLLSQPLHFGDYGGMPLKIIWALLDLLTIVILITGLYLWYVRRRRPVSIAMAELSLPARAQ
ncbi:MAG: PepSY domain-containing protein [Rhizobiales bacterium]|nr:PepSY domain-containing protein [Hyphomicrobiales bacterium]